MHRAGIDFPWVYAVERNPEGTGHHLHAYVRFRGFLSEEVVSEYAARCGFGERAWVGRVPRRASAGYCSYPLKTALAGGLQEHLQLNQGRFLHGSRNGFWLDENRHPASLQDVWPMVRAETKTKPPAS
jgi:hypothetical protein